MAGIVDTFTRLFRGSQGPERPKETEPADFESAVKTNPNDPQAWFGLGSYYAVQGDSNKAAEALERALSLRPSFEGARYMLGIAYTDQGRVEQAIQMFETVVRSTDNTMLQEYARRKIKELRHGEEAG
jgi:cytochrome c-type biogenesis protein CcmH/NrfG